MKTSIKITLLFLTICCTKVGLAQSKTKTDSIDYLPDTAKTQGKYQGPFTFNSYAAYAAAQKRNVVTVNGLIIYDTDSQPIPMYVVFIPCERSDKQSLTDFVKKQLVKGPKSGYTVYFQGVRWMLKNTKELVENLERVPLLYGINRKPEKVSYVSMIFDRTFLAEKKKAPVAAPVIVNVVVDDTTFKLRIIDDDGDLGVLKAFDKGRNP